MNARNRFQQTFTLLLDMDGPLADFDAAGYARCAALGLTIDSHLHERTARYFTDHMPHRHERDAARQFIEAAGWFRDLPVTAGAKEGVAELIAADVDVWVCTKPLERNPTCRDDKGAWLAEHFPMLEDKLIIAPDKSLICGAVLLDDAPKTEWVGRAPWSPVIFTAPFNGPGSEWEQYPHWTWGEPLHDLCDHPTTAEDHTARAST